MVVALCEVLRGLYRSFLRVSQVLTESSGRVSVIDLDWRSGGDMSRMGL